MGEKGMINNRQCSTCIEQTHGICCFDIQEKLPNVLHFMTLRTEDLELGVYLLEMKLGKLKGNKQLRKLTYQNKKKCKRHAKYSCTCISRVTTLYISRENQHDVYIMSGRE